MKPKQVSTNSKFDSFILWAGCLTATSFCIVTAYQNKAAAATVLGALTGVFLIFIYLPMMDNFAFFGLKAKLRERINEAEELTKMLRASAETSSKMLLHQLGYMNRMSEVPWETKRRFMREIEDNLSMHEIPEEQVRLMRDPLLKFLTIDLLVIPHNIVASRVAHLKAKIQRQISATFPNGIEMADPRYVELNAQWEKLRPPEDRYASLLLSEEPLRPRAFLSEMLATTQLPEDEIRRLGGFIEEVSSTAEEIWTQHTITDRSLAYLAAYPEYDSWQAKYKEIYGENP